MQKDEKGLHTARTLINHCHIQWFTTITIVTIIVNSIIVIIVITIITIVTIDTNTIVVKEWMVEHVMEYGTASQQDLMGVHSLFTVLYNEAHIGIQVHLVDGGQ